MSDRFLQLVLYFIGGLAAIFFVVAVSVAVWGGPQEPGRVEAWQPESLPSTGTAAPSSKVGNDTRPAS